MKILKILPVILCAAVLSNCATLFYEKTPTFQKAPIACGVDMFFGFTIVPLAVDTAYGACRIEGLKR
jgi:hypothetical protein